MSNEISQAELAETGPPVNERTRIPSAGAVEWPTWFLAIGIYSAWFALTLFHGHIPVWLLPVLGGWFVAWHGSLQHEAVHNHPTRSPFINALVASWPLNIYLPFELYRESHMVHHGTEELANPVDDPESYYVLKKQWAKFGGLRRLMHNVLETLLGRMIFGPFLVMYVCLAGGIKQLLVERNRRLWEVWIIHALQVIVVVAWLQLVCGMPFWKYILCFVYPGMALTLLRSYYEHRPHPTYEGRTAIVEAEPWLGLLFLHNNLHVVHHVRPAVPWYVLPSIYRAEREHWLARTDGHFFRGYAEIARRYFVTPKDSPVHPYATGEVGPRVGT